MGEFGRENFIPVRKSELVKNLSSKIPAGKKRKSFEQFCRVVESIYHFSYHENLENLKELYIPFDPDSDKLLVRIGEGETEVTPAMQEKMMKGIDSLLKTGNYKEISHAELQKSFSGSSPWGIELKVNFDEYDYYAIYYKGKCEDSFEKKFLWRKKRYDFELYGRIFFVFKLKDNVNESGNLVLSKDKLYLKIFKNVPGLDLEMLFPNTKVRISTFDKGKVVVPLVAGGVSSLYKIINYIVAQGNPVVLWHQIGFWSLVGGFFAFGLKSFLGYKSTVEKYLKTLTSSLYFQNLDNNSGVLTCLLDEAEEQECKEVILAYYFLLTDSAAHTLESLDARIERYFSEELSFDCDFEVEDAIRKLKALKLLKTEGKKLSVMSSLEACKVLDKKWDNYFNF